MNSQTKILIIIFFFFTVMSTSLFAEYVFLRDGSIVKCKIEAETKASITARLADGKQMVFNPKNVIRILYTELYMGKIFVNKTDGTVLEVYMVDEDQTSYTFRKDLYSPQEFTVKRDEVLFTTRKNPSGLTGVSKNDRIEITWKAPYTPIKNYKIYFKSADAYKPYGESSSTSATLTGLKGNTLYFIKVTAIDKEGYESLPTNEIKIKTENTLPDPPTYVKTTVKPDTNKQKISANISWKKAFDIDGSITGYRIYSKDTKGYTKVGDTNKAEYEVQNLDADKSYRFTVRSVDDKNAESGDSRLVNATLLKGYNISIMPCYILPFGKFKDLNEYGYGALVSGVKTDMFFYDLDLGVALGYWQYSGATDVDSSYMIPLMATAVYKYEVFDSLFIGPRVALGFSYNSISYKWESESFSGTKDKKSRRSIEPIAMAGFFADYNIADYWIIGAGANYGMIYETSVPMSLVVINLSVARKF